MSSIGPGEAVAALGEAVAVFADCDLSGLTHEERLVLTRELEVVRRRLDAATMCHVGELDAAGAHAIDGHNDAAACVKHLGRLSGGEAAGRVKGAAVLGRLPLVAKSYAEGLIPTGHIEALGRLARNPRVGWALESCDEYFREKAVQLDHRGFCAELKRWEHLADADGAESAAERAHRRRDAWIAQDFEGNYHIRAKEGALRGVMFATVLEAFERAEFEADWAEARERLGEAASRGDLARSSPQRRADALFKIFQLAAANPDAATPVPVVDIVIDEQTFQTELARRAADVPEDRPSHDPSRVEEVVCQSSDGTQLTPGEALLAAMVGLVRRIVVDESGNIINHGRAKRLFTGSARHAVLLREALRDPGGVRCAWAGCGVPGSRCQIDHREPAARGGPTDHVNADPACGTHNRLKETGFRPRREPDGTYTILRPDGTPITPSI